jgi:peptide/nickel transport system substrate-binding protein
MGGLSLSGFHPGILGPRLNVEHPQFKDVRVRRAVQYLVDVKAVLDAAYFGQATPALGLVPPGFPGHPDRRSVSGRDVALAKKLLAEAGVPNGFKTTLAVLNNTDSLTAAQVIQANLAEGGIDVQVTRYESGTFWNLGVEGKGTDYRNLPLCVQKWGHPPDPGGMTQYFLTEQVGKWNWQRWSDAEFDSLHTPASASWGSPPPANSPARCAATPASRPAGAAGAGSSAQRGPARPCGDRSPRGRRSGC